MDTLEILDKIERALAIPVASRVYAIGMARREFLLAEQARKRRNNDKVDAIKKAKQYVMEIEK